MNTKRRPAPEPTGDDARGHAWDDAGGHAWDDAGAPLPVMPGFREMALRRRVSRHAAPRSVE